MKTARIFSKISRAILLFFNDFTLYSGLKNLKSRMELLRIKTISQLIRASEYTLKLFIANRWNNTLHLILNHDPSVW